MRSPRLRTATLVVAPLLLLAGCSGGGDSASSSDDSAVTSAVATGDISELSVSTDGDAPVIERDGGAFADSSLPFAVSSTQTATVEEGDGPEIKAGEEVVVRYIMVNGRTGEQLLSTFDADETVVFDLSNPNIFPAFLEDLPGHKAGETLLMALPAEKAYGPNGSSQLGVEADDTMVFYLELVSSSEPLTTATGEAVEPEPGLPGVETDGTSAATITIPEDMDEPDELVVQPLIKGEGAEVKAGQTIKVHYTGVKFSDGEMFDNSYDRGEPASFPIGIGRVIKGWDEGLVGQTVGSRVLLVIPATDAYGEAPDDSASATATPTNELEGEALVFVVDILGAS